MQEVTGMQTPFYEARSFPEITSPVTFHENILGRNTIFHPHWHEAIEILCFREGVTAVGYENETLYGKSGDTIIVNSNTIHSLQTASNVSIYDCLIVEEYWLRTFDVRLDEILFPSQIRDQEVCARFRRLTEVFASTAPYRMIRTQAETLSMMAYLLEHYAASNTLFSASLPELSALIKKIVEYIREHLSEPITIDDISREVNFSKSYVCRTFHRFTGKTIMEMINSLRCAQAQTLLASKKYTVAECARMCGFSNPSYFAKTYKHFIGELPSETRRSDSVQ